MIWFQIFILLVRFLSLHSIYQHLYQYIHHIWTGFKKRDYTKVWVEIISIQNYGLFLFSSLCFSVFSQPYIKGICDFCNQRIQHSFTQRSLLSTHHAPGTVPWSEDTVTNKLNENLCPCELTSQWRRHAVQKKKKKRKITSMFEGDIKLTRRAGVKW